MNLLFVGLHDDKTLPLVDCSFCHTILRSFSLLKPKCLLATWLKLHKICQSTQPSFQPNQFYINRIMLLCKVANLAKLFLILFSQIADILAKWLTIKKGINTTQQMTSWLPPPPPHSIFLQASHTPLQNTWMLCIFFVFFNAIPLSFYHTFANENVQPTPHAASTNFCIQLWTCTHPTAINGL